MARDPPPGVTEFTLLVQYLEIVMPDVDATCVTPERLHGVSFGAVDAGLGGTPDWAECEPRSREAAVDAAGAEIDLPPTEIPGHGRCAIYLQGGIQHGLWQL